MRPTRLRLTALAVLLWTGPAACPAHAEAIRGYLTLRVGAGVILDNDIGDDLDASAAQQLISVGVGVNLTRHWGVELAGDSWETDLRFPGLGTIGEYALYTLIPQVRLRYPLLDGRLTGYAVGGAGVGYTEFNDRKAPAIGLRIEANELSPVAAAGVGVEYFVADNIAVGVETRYVLFRGPTFEIEGRREDLVLDSLLISGGLRIFFP